MIENWNLITRYQKENVCTYGSQLTLFSSALMAINIAQQQDEYNYGVIINCLIKHTDNGGNLWISPDYLMQINTSSNPAKIPPQASTGQRLYFFPNTQGRTQLVDITGFISFDVVMTPMGAEFLAFCTTNGTTLEQPSYIASFEIYRRQSSRLI